MAKARTASLSTTDRARLTVARQALRRGRRPAMNSKRVVRRNAIASGYRKIWFSSRAGVTAGLILSEQTFKNTRSVEAFSRLFPHTEARYMTRFHYSPVFETWDEAFAYPTTKGGSPKDNLPVSHNPTSRPMLTPKTDCKMCHGTGLADDYRSVCRVCHGSGKITQGVLTKRNPERGRRFYDLPIGTKFYFQGDFGRTHSQPYYKLTNHSAAPKIDDPYAGTVAVNRNEMVLVEAYPPPRTNRTRRVKRNPSGRMQRLGRALEVRYDRTVGARPGFYKHEIRSRRAGLYTIPAGWVYVSGKSILITEGKPHV